MKHLLFYDGVCPNPYTLEMLATEPLGGTEATVLRVARALGKTHLCMLLQRHRQEAKPDPIASISYHPLNYRPPSEQVPDVVITLRDGTHYVENRKRWPQARHFLWLHDVVDGPYKEHLLSALGTEAVNAICVSQWHAKQVDTALGVNFAYRKMHMIYNPLAEYCVRELPLTYDRNKLVFFSSPHKSLDHTLRLFKWLHGREPAMRLYVANPGYFKSAGDLPSGVISLGSLPHRDVIGHVRESLAVFYPNISFAETFGLVMAEANAVGTPVLTHPIGAASEILAHPAQLMDCREEPRVIERILRWREGERPVVRGNPAFTEREVLKQWLRLIDNPLRVI